MGMRVLRAIKHEDSPPPFPELLLTPDSRTLTPPLPKLSMREKGGPQEKQQELPRSYISIRILFFYTEYITF